jgi:uncharacterized membrane protein YjjB (DUF3815 family)
MKPFVFFFFATILLIALLFIKSPKEGNLPLIAFCLAMGTIISMILFDHWRQPEVYAKKQNQ